MMVDAVFLVVDFNCNKGMPICGIIMPETTTKFVIRSHLSVWFKVCNETADDFLTLLGKWEELCWAHSLFGTEPQQPQSAVPDVEVYEDEDEEDDDEEDDDEIAPREFEVDYFMDIYFGDPKSMNRCGLYYKKMFLIC